MPGEKITPSIPEYRNPQEGLRSKLPTKLANYYRHTIGKQGLELYPGDEAPIVSNPISHDLIYNDGSSTFIVHGTTKEAADKILDQGLGLNGQYHNPDVPDLEETTKMLAPQSGKGSKDATNRNVHGLAYTYNDGRRDNRYKVVMELTTPNPGTSLATDQFAGTPLEQADGVNVIAHNDESPHGKPYSVPPERIRGYFDTETGAFTHNERFVAVADALAHLAVGHEVEQPPMNSSSRPAK
jgi:hypothetical protein